MFIHNNKCLFIKIMQVLLYVEINKILFVCFIHYMLCINMLTHLIFLKNLPVCLKSSNKDKLKALRYSGKLLKKIVKISFNMGQWA